MLHVFLALIGNIMMIYLHQQSVLISDVDIVPRRSPRSNRGDCDNSTSNQMITNTTEGYENDNEVINPVVGYEKHLDQKDKVGVE